MPMRWQEAARRQLRASVPGTIWRAFRKGLIDRALEAESVAAAYSWVSLHHS